MRARVCVCSSIHREGFTCLDQLDNRGTDQRFHVEDVIFLCQVPSSLLQSEASNLSNQSVYPVRILEAGKPLLN